MARDFVNCIHRPETEALATELYFKIERHYAKNRTPLTYRDVNKLLGLRSAAAAHMYVAILKGRGWLKQDGVHTIIPTPLFPVEYAFEEGKQCVR